MAKLSPSSLLPSLAVAATITVWAIAFPAIKLALLEMHPLPLASARYAIGHVFRCGLAALEKARPDANRGSGDLRCLRCVGRCRLQCASEPGASHGVRRGGQLPHKDGKHLDGHPRRSDAEGSIQYLGLGRNLDRLYRNRPDCKRPARRHCPGRRRRICSRRRNLFGNWLCPAAQACSAVWRAACCLHHAHLRRQ